MSSLNSSRTDGTPGKSPLRREDGGEICAPIASSTPVPKKATSSKLKTGSSVTKHPVVNSRSVGKANVNKNKKSGEAPVPQKNDESKVNKQQKGLKMPTPFEKKDKSVQDRPLQSSESKSKLTASSLKPQSQAKDSTEKTSPGLKKKTPLKDSTAKTDSNPRLRSTPSKSLDDAKTPEKIPVETLFSSPGAGSDERPQKEEMSSLSLRKASMTLPIPSTPAIPQMTEASSDDTPTPTGDQMSPITIEVSRTDTSLSLNQHSFLEDNRVCAASLPLSPSIPIRRRLSFIPTLQQQNTSYADRRASEVSSIRGSLSFEELKRGNNSVDSLRVLNRDMRDQVTKLRSQLDNQRGSIRNAHWQQVVDIRQMREQEQQRLNVALTEQFQKLEKDKHKELDQLREQLNKKHESELQKSGKFKDTEISKLKQEVSSKDAMLRRLLGESRRAQMKLDIDDRKLRLIDELKELRQAKRELMSSLENASFAERTFSNHLRRHSESFESEISRVKKEAQIEIRQLQA